MPIQLLKGCVFLAFLPLFLITVLNRGGAAISFGINIVALLLIFSVILLAYSHLLKLTAEQWFLILFVDTFLVLSFFKFITASNVDDDALKSLLLGVLPCVCALGLISAKYFNSSLYRYLFFMLACCMFYALFLPITKTLLHGKILINGVSLFGVYGSYYTNTIIALCLFISFAKNNWTVTYIFIPLSIFANVILTARSALISLTLIISTALILPSTRAAVKKTVVPIMLVICFGLFIIQLTSQFLPGVKARLLNFEFLYYQFLSIFFHYAGSDIYGELFLGSRGHRIDMIFETLDRVEEFGSTFFGLPLDYNLVSAGFRSPHNGYLSYYGRFGIFGITLFGITFSLILFNSFRNLVNSNFESKYCFLFLSLLSSTLMIGFTTFLDSPMNACLFYFLLGIAAVENQYSSFDMMAAK